MTPRTRTSNKDANYEVYYSKKVPKQVHFPHKRKTVRRPASAEQDGVDMRQMKFLPEKMKQRKVDGDEISEDDEQDVVSTAEAPLQEETSKATPANRRKGRKRESTEVQDSETDNELVTSSSKRRRQSNPQRDEPSRTFRRQSTMTQLADGRRPSLGAEEPDFKPLKRRSRVSWGGSTENERDKKQRTLTQMIPGIGRLSKEELEELSDLDAELEKGGPGTDAVSQSLVEQGLLEVENSPRKAAIVSRSVEVEANSATVQAEVGHDSPVNTNEQSSVVVQSVEALPQDDDEEDYQPTQFIEAPARRTRQTPRRKVTRQPPSKSTTPGKSSKPRFGLLATPEKRRVFEIPSSQSPAEFILSTQTSPQKSSRSALRERNSNVTAVAETPSKHRQVTFQTPAIQPTPPARLRKFESTIQDSEDEDGSEIEDDVVEQDYTDTAEGDAHGQTVGADTQAVINQIDQACAHADKDQRPGSRESSMEPEELLVRQGPYEPSPELGESWAPVMYDDDGPGYGSYRSSRTEAKSQSFGEADSSKESLPVLHQTIEVSQLDLTTQAPAVVGDIPSTPPIVQPEPEDNLPSTPMVIMDESSDEAAEEPVMEPTQPHTVQCIAPQPPSTLIHQSTDLDGEPVQVPRSPSAERETQQSHSSKAEQQLQNEWLSYSQYVHAREPNSSSMHAAADPFSYHATPRIPNKDTVAASSARIQHSQATTVDEVTPRKKRTQRIVSADTTPHRPSKSQPFISPEKPPSPFIPSSFPSPSRAAMEGWSSPAIARTQNLYGSSQVLGSLEDFSIPLPPPVEDD